MKRKTLILAAAAVLISAGAAAQPGPDTPQRERAQADTNGDGSISRAEAQAAAETRWTRMDVNRDGQLNQADRDQMGAQQPAPMFQRLDSDGNGTITREEFMAAVERRHAAMDSNSDGNVTAAERQANRPERRGRGARRAQ
jgi:hypothetical protein